MAAVDSAVEIEIGQYRLQAEMAARVVGANVAGLTHEQSLMQPRPAGNCLNWVMGHLLWAHDGALRLLGQEPVVPEGALERYARGGRPLTDPAEAMDFAEMVAAWERAAERVDAGLAALTPERLAEPAPFSPGGNPDETVRSLVQTLLFHQAYHGGLGGVLRRGVGAVGAIA
jgi:hypothetical protein